MANPDITGGGGTQGQDAAANYSVTYTTMPLATAEADLLNGDIDFAISPTFNDNTTISNIPLLFSPIAIVYNLSGKKTLRLSSSTLAKIFAGQITTWNDPAIKAENTKVTLPSTNITVLYPSSNMDETYGFTNYLNKTSPAIWTKSASTSFSSAFPGTISTDGSFQAFMPVAQATALVKGTNGAITYMGLKETLSNKLTTAYIKNSNNKYVKPTSATATKLISNAASIGATGIVTFDYAKMNIGVGYPIVAVYYGWRRTDANEPLVKAFFDYLVTDYIKTKSKYYAKTSGNNQTKIVELINNITNS